MRNSKEKAKASHHNRKTKERVKASVTNSLNSELAAKIQRSEGKFLEKKSNRLSVWEVEYLGSKYQAIYDKERKGIADLKLI